MAILDQLRRGVAQIFYGKELQKVTDLTNAVMEMYYRRPISTSPDQFKIDFKEMDPELMDLLIRQIMYADPYSRVKVDETARKSSVTECRKLYIWDVVSQASVDLWTDFGFGVRVSVQTIDPNAQKVWDEFWKASRNRAILGERHIHELSTDLLTDGEIWFGLFRSTLDGSSAIATFPTEQITEIIYDSRSAKAPVWYKREYTSDNGIEVRYYRDWLASEDMIYRTSLPEGSKEAFDEMPSTEVVVMPVLHRRRNGRGWPLMTAGASWSREYRNFLQNRASVMKAVATYVDRVKVKGGSRMTDLISQRLSSTLTRSNTTLEKNPVPPAGTDWVENDALSRSRMPLTTGAADAKDDGSMLIGQAGLGARIYPHYLGFGEAYRLATASAMETPVFRAFNRYQLFWASVWQDLVRFVLESKEKYGQEQFSTTDARINSDNILTLDVDTATTLIESVNDSVDQGTLLVEEGENIVEQILRSCLSTMGIPEAGTLFSPTESPEEEAPTEVTEFFRGRGGLPAADRALDVLSVVRRAVGNPLESVPVSNGNTRHVRSKRSVPGRDEGGRNSRG